MSYKLQRKEELGESILDYIPVRVCVCALTGSVSAQVYFRCYPTALFFALNVLLKFSSTFICYTNQKFNVNSDIKSFIVNYF